jgi:hypothetical protein
MAQSVDPTQPRQTCRLIGTSIPLEFNRRNGAQVLTDLQEKPGQLRDKFGGNAAQSREQVRPRLSQVHATGLIEQEDHFAAPAADVSSRDDPTAVT